MEGWSRYTRVPTTDIELRGNFRQASIVRVRDLQTDEILRADRNLLTGKNDKSLHREAEILRELSHPNVIRFHDSFEAHGQFYILTEVFERTLVAHVNEHNARDMFLKPDSVRSYLYQLCCGVAHCHARGVMHRNLLLSYLTLIDGNTRIKIVGFSSARRFVDSSDQTEMYRLTLPVGAIGYRAPEILLGSPSYGAAIDCWTIGVIFETMATGGLPFLHDSILMDYGEIGMLFGIFQTRGTPTETSWPGVNQLPHYSRDKFPIWPKQPFEKGIWRRLDENGCHLLDKLLSCDPASRITAHDALSHPYFDSLDKSSL